MHKTARKLIVFCLPRYFAPISFFKRDSVRGNHDVSAFGKLRTVCLIWCRRDRRLRSFQDQIGQRADDEQGSPALARAYFSEEGQTTLRARTLRQHIQWSGGRRSHNPPHPILLGFVDTGAAWPDQVNVHQASFGGEANRKRAKHIQKTAHRSRAANDRIGSKPVVSK